MIETTDSVQLVEAVNSRCALEDKVMPLIIEIKSGKESNKTGALFDKQLNCDLENLFDVNTEISMS